MPLHRCHPVPSNTAELQLWCNHVSLLIEWSLFKWITKLEGSDGTLTAKMCVVT